jgi:hypothetical protein
MASITHPLPTGMSGLIVATDTSKDGAGLNRLLGGTFTERGHRG